MQMAAPTFTGLSQLAHLVELDVGNTRFDDECCGLLASLSKLQKIK
jgi:hypothetical protein